MRKRGFYDQVDNCDEELLSNREARILRHSTQITATRERGAQPVGSEARAKAARKETYGSRKAGKRIARTTTGIRSRRLKKMRD